MTFEEYKAIQLEGLKQALRGYRLEEILDYWERNQDWVKDSYDSFIKNNKKNPLSDGLVYAMSLDF